MSTAWFCASFTLSWSFQGLTDLPTRYSDLQYDLPFIGFVQGDRMRLLACSSLSGRSGPSLWSAK